MDSLHGYLRHQLLVFGPDLDSASLLGHGQRQGHSHCWTYWCDAAVKTSRTSSWMQRQLRLKQPQYGAHQELLCHHHVLEIWLHFVHEVRLLSDLLFASYPGC